MESSQFLIKGIGYSLLECSVGSRGSLRTYYNQMLPDTRRVLAYYDGLANQYLIFLFSKDVDLKPEFKIMFKVPAILPDYDGAFDLDSTNKIQSGDGVLSIDRDTEVFNVPTQLIEKLERIPKCTNQQENGSN